MAQSCRGDFLKTITSYYLNDIFFKSLSSNNGIRELQTQELRRKQRAVNTFRERGGR